jgi:hypothetical protein
MKYRVPCTSVGNEGEGEGDDELSCTTRLLSICGHCHWSCRNDQSPVSRTVVDTGVDSAWWWTVDSAD